MVVIEKIYLEAFQTEKAKIQTELETNFVDIVPIPILNDLFILPDSVLFDDIFKKIFINFKHYVIREVTENEFIKHEIK
jgi:hypothetical protein